MWFACKCVRACMCVSAVCSTFYRASAVCPVTCGSWFTAVQPHKSRRLNQDKSWQQGCLPPALHQNSFSLLPPSWESKASPFSPPYTLLYFPPASCVKQQRSESTEILCHVIFSSAVDREVFSCVSISSFYFLQNKSDVSKFRQSTVAIRKIVSCEIIENYIFFPFEECFLPRRVNAPHFWNMLKYIDASEKPSHESVTTFQPYLRGFFKVQLSPLTFFDCNTSDLCNSRGNFGILEFHN